MNFLWKGDPNAYFLPSPFGLGVCFACPLDAERAVDLLLGKAWMYRRVVALLLRLPSLAAGSKADSTTLHWMLDPCSCDVDPLL